MPNFKVVYQPPLAIIQCYGLVFNKFNIMATTKKAISTVVKSYQGRTYVFVPEKGRGYKVSAKGYSTYWYQSTTSVREAKRRMDS